MAVTWVSQVRASAALGNRDFDEGPFDGIAVGGGRRQEKQPATGSLDQRLN
jgi:hypothetical protein